MNAGTSELTWLEISFHSLKGVIFSKGCKKKERKKLILLLTAEIRAEGNSPVRSVSYMLQEQQNRKVQQGIILFFLFFLKKISFEFMGSDKPVWRVPSPEESRGILQHRVIAAD